MAGDATFSSGTYTVAGAGADIWGSRDEFHFVYQPVTGDVEIVARVASLQGSNGFSKGGVMIRESLTDNARHALAHLTVGNGYRFLRRTATGGTTTSTACGAGTAPGWVRLTRRANAFEMHSSVNGQTWTSCGVIQIAMTPTIYVGLAVSNVDATRTATAVFDQVTVTGGAAANQPPTVALTGPANGATFTAPATLNLTANASDPENRLARVEFYADATLIGSDPSAPFSFTWSSVPAGSYTLTARAVDSDGAQATSAPVAVTVSAPNQLPSVTLTAPANGATFTAPATITLAAAASDPENRLARVEFYSGPLLIGTDTAAPFSFTWSAVPAGSYVLSARALDSDGGTAQSSNVTVTVVPPAESWTVVFTASSDHTTKVTSYLLEVFPTGANPETATPSASTDLGKPTPNASQEIAVDRSSFFNGLAAGNYIATVSAIGPDGRGRSEPASFSR